MGCLSFASRLLKIILFFLMTQGKVGFAKEEVVRLSLMSEFTRIEKESTLLLGLNVHLIPGWKTYWRSPGVAGYGVTLNWEQSRNIKSARLLWPLPHWVETPLGKINAYAGNMIFPLSVEVIDPSQPVHASVDVDMLVCDESNCLPVSQQLTLDLPVGPSQESPDADLLRHALSTVPKQESLGHQGFGPVCIQSVELKEIDETPPKVQIVLSKDKDQFTEHDLPELFLEMKDYVIDAPDVSLSPDHQSVFYSAAVYSDANRTPVRLPNLTGKPITLTIGYQNRGIEVDHILKAPSFHWGYWVVMLLIAFVGGLILNIMPCVLPVLSLKVLSVIRHGGGHYATVRQEFIATVLGIVFSFLVLAGGAILLKVSGHAVGWGMQFQEPYFLIGLIGILTVFCCNLFGFFEFRLPAFLSFLGGRPSLHQESLMGSFLEGSLVTALATPCTAPFLGTALAFALSHGNFEILSIFIAMGVGLSFPFLLIALFPSMATRLPKPGAWMVIAKKGMGFLILITALWLLYVLIAQMGFAAASLVATLMVGVAFILNHVHLRSEKAKRLGWAGVVFLIATSFVLPSFFYHSTFVSTKKDTLWHPFDPARIDDYIRAGKTVFVNVTADWCLTCQANKYFVLKSQAVLEALYGKNVIAMEADWTNHDPKITTYLKSFNQYGIPFYAVYGCRTPKGLFLGQLLTSQKVLDALQAEKCLISGKMASLVR